QQGTVTQEISGNDPKQTRKPANEQRAQDLGRERWLGGAGRKLGASVCEISSELDTNRPSMTTSRPLQERLVVTLPQQATGKRSNSKTSQQRS
ncbi:hypothetical protein CHARACLAT_024966, partial [Characodon lateralis]|nr:hypothetical protein [Characodon lateralis]